MFSSSRILWTSNTLSGAHVTFTSSRNAKIFSSSCILSRTALSARCRPGANKSGMRGSLCSPPFLCGMSCVASFILPQVRRRAGCWILHRRLSSVKGTMWRCGSACAISCRSRPVKSRMSDRLQQYNAHDFGRVGVARQAAYWSSWADCLPMVHQRYPSVAANLVAQLRGGIQGSFFRAVAEAVHS